MQKDSHETLQAAYDRALAALVMDSYAQSYGEKTLRELAATQKDGETDSLPPELDAACRSLLKKAPKPSTGRKKRLWKTAGVVAATMALLLCLLVVTQAGGLNIVGTLARWTDEEFYVIGNASEKTDAPDASYIALPDGTDIALPDGPYVSPRDDLAAIMKERDLPLSLLPTYLPAEYKLLPVEAEGCSDIILTNNFTYVNEQQEYFVIDIWEARVPGGLNDVVAEKSPGPVEEYTTNGRLFYLFDNAGEWVAVWSDGTYFLGVAGPQEKESLIEIINSITGVS